MGRGKTGFPVKNDNGMDIESMSIRRRNLQIDVKSTDFILIERQDAL